MVFHNLTALLLSVLFIFETSHLQAFAFNKTTAADAIAFIENQNLYMGSIIETSTLLDGFLFKVEYPYSSEYCFFEYRENDGAITILISENDKTNSFIFNCNGDVYFDGTCMEYMPTNSKIAPVDSGWVYKYFTNETSALAVWGSWNPDPAKTVSDIELFTFTTNIAQMTTPALAAIISNYLGVPANDLFSTATSIINYAISLVNGLFGFQIYYNSYTDTSKQPLQYMQKITATYTVENNLIQKTLGSSEHWEYRVLA